MHTWKIAAIALALGVASSTALAFQEQQGGAAPSAGATAAPSAPAAPSEAAAGKAVELAPADLAGKAGAGTEVRIPGIGRLGVLPKMDFGLELLYGASEGKQSVEPQREGASEDVTIRGTLKHRF